MKPYRSMIISFTYLGAVCTYVCVCVRISYSISSVIKSSRTLNVCLCPVLVAYLVFVFNSIFGHFRCPVTILAMIYLQDRQLGTITSCTNAPVAKQPVQLVKAGGHGDIQSQKRAAVQVTKGAQATFSSVESPNTSIFWGRAF